jgi:hypothetical protein
MIYNCSESRDNTYRRKARVAKEAIRNNMSFLPISMAVRKNKPRSKDVFKQTEYSECLETSEPSEWEYITIGDKADHSLPSSCEVEVVEHYRFFPHTSSRLVQGPLCTFR